MQDVPRTEVPSSPPPPRCAQRFALPDRAVGEGLDHPGDADSRMRAPSLARAVLEGCQGCGSREDPGTLGSVASLLERPSDAGASAVADLRERFRGPLRFLKAQARAWSA